MSNCYCLEFSFAKVSEYDLTYTNCTGGTTTETFLSGTTYNICSQDLDPITSCLDIVFNVKGLCIEGVCPPPLYKYQNECDVITIFPMGVQCYVTQPSSIKDHDGSVTLQITGGTPPYYVLWNNGSISTSITNLGVGSYSSTVVDFYGDFTANTTCVLTGQTITPTPTPTPTATPPPLFDDLCFVIKGRLGKNSFVNLYNFNYNGYYNGKPTWVSDDTLYDIVWMSGTSQWEVSGWTIGSAVNLNPVTPPVTGWQILGSTFPYVITEFTVSEGSCDSLDILRYDLTVNQPTCNCDGSIIFNVIDGVPPYQYSINGLTYFTSPIFNNLCPGLYPTRVIDSSGQTFNSTVSLSTPPPPQIYEVSLSLDVDGNSFDVNVSPTLPVGVSVEFDLVHTSNFQVSPDAGAATYNNVVTVNVDSTPVTYSTVANSGSSTLIPSKNCFGAVDTTTTSIYTWQNITMTQGTTINGTITDVITPITPLACFYSAVGNYSLNLNNVRINNCPCCSVVVINPPITI
jgi:hypothetical protein